MEQQIQVVSDMKNLGEWLDGSRVERTRLIPQGGRLQLEMTLTRAMQEKQRVVRQGLFSKTLTPWIRGRLRLSSIKEASIERLCDSGPADQMPFLSCEAVPGGYTMEIHPPDGLRLLLHLEQLSGHYVDVGSPIDSP